MSNVQSPKTRAKVPTERSSVAPNNGWTTAVVISIREIPDNAADDVYTLSYYEVLRLHSISNQRKIDSHLCSEKSSQEGNHSYQRA